MQNDKILASVDVRPGDPEAGPKLTELLARALAAGQEAHLSPGDWAASARATEAHLANATWQLQTMVFTVIGTMAGALGAAPDTVSVDLLSTGDDGKTQEILVRTTPKDADPVTLARVTFAIPEAPTATTGWTGGFLLHLTPAGCRPWWDFGDVIQADAREEVVS